MLRLSLEKHLQELGFQTKPRISILKPEDRTNHVEDFELSCVKNGSKLTEYLLREIIVDFYTQIKREMISVIATGNNKLYGFRDQPLNFGLSLTYFGDKAYITVMSLRHHSKPSEEDIVCFAE